MPYMVLEQYMFTCDFGFLYVIVSVSFRKTAVECLGDRTVFQVEFFSEASRCRQSCITIVGAMTFLTDKMTAALIVCEGPVINVGRGGFRHVQHVRPNRGPTRGPFVALNSLLQTCSVCIYYVMQILNKMSMMTTLSPCVSCEFSRAAGGIHILGRGPHCTHIVF